MLVDVLGVPKLADSRKPIFLKCLEVLWRAHPTLNANNTLLIHDTRYKSICNPWHCCICPGTFDPEDNDQDPYFLTNTLFHWLVNYSIANNPKEYVIENMMYNAKDTVSNLVM